MAKGMPVAGFFKGVLMSPFVLVAVAFLIERPWLLLLPLVFVAVIAIVTGIKALHELDMQQLRQPHDTPRPYQGAPLEPVVMVEPRPLPAPHRRTL